MMRSYRNMKMLTQRDEISFLEMLSMQMNTSVEQLRSTYVAIDHRDYLSTAKALIRALYVTTGEGNTCKPLGRQFRSACGTLFIAKP